MEKRRLGIFFVFSVIFSLGLVSFVSCIVAESKRAKVRDLRLDGKLCFLPETHAVVFGITALMCLSAAELIGSLLFCANCFSRDKGKASKPIIPAILLVFSWISFGLAVILISLATSMSRVQRYGEGWVDGECYIVRDGVYIGSGVLSLVTVFILIGAAAMTITTQRNKGDQDQKVHAQNA